jgi:uncharacterized protein (TIGR03083 family)
VLFCAEASPERQDAGVEISPRYEGPAIISIGGAPEAIAEPFLRQRGRLLDVLGSLTDEQWRASSRCDGWTVQDVATHLVSVDGFWGLSINEGLRGSPSRFLVGFDPKATPDQLVDAARGVSPSETLAALTGVTAPLLDLVRGLDASSFAATAEAPPGHISVSGLLHHALWDAWVHERDILEPLGLAQERHDDEVLVSLRYAAALAPAFAISNGETRHGAMAVVTPQATIVVAVDGDVVRVADGSVPDGALVLEGDAVDLLEALSIRRPLPVAIADEHAWLLAGLAEVFESA